MAPPTPDRATTPLLRVPAEVEEWDAGLDAPAEPSGRRRSHDPFSTPFDPGSGGEETLIGGGGGLWRALAVILLMALAAAGGYFGRVWLEARERDPSREWVTAAVGCPDVCIQGSGAGAGSGAAELAAVPGVRARPGEVAAAVDDAAGARGAGDGSGAVARNGASPGRGVAEQGGGSGAASGAVPVGVPDAAGGTGVPGVAAPATSAVAGEGTPVVPGTEDAAGAGIEAGVGVEAGVEPEAGADLVPALEAVPSTAQPGPPVNLPTGLIVELSQQGVAFAQREASGRLAAMNGLGPAPPVAAEPLPERPFDLVAGGVRTGCGAVELYLGRPAEAAACLAQARSALGEAGGPALAELERALGRVQEIAAVVPPALEAGRCNDVEGQLEELAALSPVLAESFREPLRECERERERARGLPPRTLE